MPEETKQDMLDRKLSWVEKAFDKLFTAIKEDVKGTFIAILIMYSAYITIKYINLTDLSKAEIIAEVRRTAKAEAKIQVTQQMEPIRAKQDSTAKEVGTSLINLNGTVESVKEYYNKNKKK